jgi:hypothetical protein
MRMILGIAVSIAVASVVGGYVAAELQHLFAEINTALTLAQH